MLDLDCCIRSAAGHDRERLFATLTAAFACDPAVRWMYPDPDQHRRYFPEFAAAFAGRAIERGTAFCAADCKAVSLWLPPDIGPDEALLGQVIEDSVPAEDRETVFALFEEMARHHPSEPHWYLPLIGVDPETQGQGLGSELMRHALRICDREGLPAYLESTNPRNIPLYQRHGFDISGTIRVGSSPPIVPMQRRPA